MVEKKDATLLTLEEKVERFGDIAVTAASHIDDIDVAQKIMQYAGILADIYEMGAEVGVAEGDEMRTERDRLDKELEELGMRDPNVMGVLARVGAAKVAYLR